MDYKKIALNKATLHIFKTKKFKKISIDILLSDVVSETNLSYRTLLSRVMESKSKKYQTKRDINRKLDMLYGANFGISSSKLGFETPFFISKSLEQTHRLSIILAQWVRDAIVCLRDNFVLFSFSPSLSPSLHIAFLLL